MRRSLSLEILFFFCYLAVSVLCGFFYCSIAPSPDQSLFDYIAWQGIQGVHWYVGSFDFTWPGSLVIHEVGIRLFGVHHWTARLTDFILLQPTVVAMYLFFSAADLKLAATGSALFYPIIYVTSGGWMAGHRDIVAMHVLIIAASILVTSCPKSTTKLFTSGILVGFSVLIRPTYLIFLPLAFCCCFLPLKRSTLTSALRAGLLLMLGALIAPSAFFVAGFITSTLDRFIIINRSVFELYAVPVSRARLFLLFVKNVRTYFAWLSVAGLSGSFLWVNERTVWKQAALLLSMAFTSLLSFVVQNKGFGYHLGGLIPVFSMSALGGVNLGIIRWAGSAKPKALTVVAGAILCVIGAGTAQRIQHNIFPYLNSAFSYTTVEVSRETTDQLVSTISKESDPASFFFQWGWNYDVGFLSQRLSASQFVNTGALSLIDDNDLRYRPWLQTFDQELSKNKPAFILLDLTTLPNHATVDDRGVQFREEVPSPALAILARHLNEKYSIRQKWRDSVLFRRTRD
jgi:hypothetical protein